MSDNGLCNAVHEDSEDAIPATCVFAKGHPPIDVLPPEEGDPNKWDHANPDKGVYWNNYVAPLTPRERLEALAETRWPDIEVAPENLRSYYMSGDDPAVDRRNEEQATIIEFIDMLVDAGWRPPDA